MSAEKYDDKKLRYDLIDPLFIEGLTAVRTHGVSKHGEDSWLNVTPKRWEAALQRHLAEYRKAVDGHEHIDKDSELLHIDHMTCCLMYMRAFLLQEHTTLKYTLEGTIEDKDYWVNKKEENKDGKP